MSVSTTFLKVLGELMESGIASCWSQVSSVACIVSTPELAMLRPGRKPLVLVEVFSDPVQDRRFSTLIIAC